MRENRQSGSAGGEAGTTGLPYPDFNVDYTGRQGFPGSAVGFEELSPVKHHRGLRILLSGRFGHCWLEQLPVLRGKTIFVRKPRGADRHPAVQHLMTIPGVGIRTAETFVAWVDDITRFRRTRQLGAYFGLIPCQDQSASKNRLGHITRDGPPVMRKLICEAAWTAVKKCPAFKAYFERITAGKPERKKIAIVATSHRLIRVMGAMMRSGTAYDPDYKSNG